MSQETEFSKEIIQKIMAQTTYSEEVSKEKLRQFNGDFMKVLKDYMGIKVAEEPKPKVKSVNQEIYRQIRHTLDNSMRQYREKNPLDIEQVTNNLMESEERENAKK